MGSQFEFEAGAKAKVVNSKNTATARIERADKVERIGAIQNLIFKTFLSDPGVPGVRSMGLSVSKGR